MDINRTVYGYGSVGHVTVKSQQIDTGVSRTAESIGKFRVRCPVGLKVFHIAHLDDEDNKRIMSLPKEAEFLLSLEEPFRGGNNA